MKRDDVVQAYGDGWYDGFIAAKELAEKVDLSDYDTDQILKMSEQAESENQTLKASLLAQLADKE